MVREVKWSERDEVVRERYSGQGELNWSERDEVVRQRDEAVSEM